MWYFLQLYKMGLTYYSFGFCNKTFYGDYRIMTTKSVTKGKTY